jgi:hypothetical protein
VPPTPLKVETSKFVVAAALLMGMGERSENDKIVEVRIDQNAIVNLRNIGLPLFMDKDD